MSSLGPGVSIPRRFVFLVIGISLAGFGLYYAFKSKLPEQVANSPAPVAEESSAAEIPSTTTPSCSTTQLSVLNAQDSFDQWKRSLESITSLPDKLSAIRGMNACLSDLSQVVAGASTRSATVAMESGALEAAIQQAKEDIEVAKDRAILAKFPEYTRSYYDSWFSLDRPLRRQTAPILIGFSLFFICMTFLSILSFLRMDVRILVPMLSAANTPLAQQAKQPLFMFILALLVVVSAVSIWAFTR